MKAEPHHQDLRADLQSPSAELLHTLRVGADVLQKLFYWEGVLLTAYIDVRGQVLQYINRNSHRLFQQVLLLPIVIQMLSDLHQMAHTIGT